MFTSQGAIKSSLTGPALLPWVFVIVNMKLALSFHLFRKEQVKLQNRLTGSRINAGIAVYGNYSLTLATSLLLGEGTKMDLK